MVAVTFIYKINGVMMHGKYIGYISDDYSEGLDKEILNIISSYFIDVYDNYDIQIGITGVIDTDHFFSDDEKNVFDLLYIEHPNGFGTPTVYIHGDLIQL